jgi:tRNA nucleotidyltransferase/poly(A) polymerase
MSPSFEDKELSPYAGRWVARVRGKIVAQGRTSDEAEKSARQNRPKELPVIEFVPPADTPFSNPMLSSVLQSLSSLQEIYLVGGAVRDFLLGHETHDLDFVVPGDGLKIARRVAKALNGAFFPLDTTNDIGRVVITNDDQPRVVLDFSSYRGDGLKSDLFARDFSINAIAFNLRSQQIEDPVGGLSDIRGKSIRVCSSNSIIDDPVRIIRAVRFAARLGFSINKETRQSLKASVGLLPRISPERIRDELFKILDGQKPSSAIKALDILGALPYIIPEILELKGVIQPSPHKFDVWDHTLKVIDHLETIFNLLALDFDSPKANDLMNGLLTMKLGRYHEQFRQHYSSVPGAERSLRSLIFFSALYHDIGKPRKLEAENGRIRFHGHDEEGGFIAVKRAIKLRLSNSEMDLVRVIIQNHMRLLYHVNRLDGEGKHPTRRAIYRFFRDTDEAGVDLCLLALADQRATYDTELTQQTWTACLEVVRIFLENWWEKRETTISPPQLVNGNDLMTALNILPGPDLGKMLEAIREAQAMGIIEARDQAINLAEKWLADHHPSK